MHDEFEMCMMGELNFFLGLQIKQMEDGILFNQSKYIKEMLKKFGLEDSHPTKTSMSTEIKLIKDDESDFVDNSKYRETIIYADSNHAGDYVDRKSTSGVCTFMGCCLTSWFAKKQTAFSISTTEAEYVFTGKACQQALWIKQALIEYDIHLDDVLIMCNNKGRIIIPSFIIENNMLPFFEAIGLDPFLTFNEPICPRFVVKFYHSLEVKRKEKQCPYIELKLSQLGFKLTSSQLSQILQTPYALETFYTSKWSLNSLDDHPNSNLFGSKHDLVKKTITTPRTTQAQLLRDSNKLYLDDIHPELKTSNTLHNAIMEAGGKDRPPMLAPGNYFQWKSRIKRYIDTKPNHELIHYCLQNPPYKYKWADKDVPVSEGSTETITERSQQAATRNTGKANVNSPPPIYDQEPSMVAEDDEIGIGYDNQRIVNVTGARETIEQADWRDDTDDEPRDQELEAHYMYMAQIQEVTPDAADNSGPIFDSEPLQKLVEIILFIVDSGCSKHMTGNLKLLTNFVEKFLGTVKFRNDQIAPILGYGDLVQGTVTIKRVYYVEGLNHNLFSVSQLCDADLEVAFRKSTCYIRNLKGTDLLTDKVVLVSKGSPETTTKRYIENYKNVSQDIHDQLNAKAKAVQIILIGIDNDTYSTIDACPNACEMWKAMKG
nr:copia protein [Tanacetum cinerariifolium]